MQPKAAAVDEAINSKAGAEDRRERSVQHFVTLCDARRNVTAEDRAEAARIVDAARKILLVFRAAATDAASRSGGDPVFIEART